MLSARVQRCTEGGLSILVGTVDGEGFPSCCRAFALTSNDNLATATVYLPVAISQEMIANIATTRRIAVFCSEPMSHDSIQLKGTTRTVRLASEAEGELLRTRLEQFAAVLDGVGLPKRITRSLAFWPAFAVEFNVDNLFEQTPGPKAGDVLR